MVYYRKYRPQNLDQLIGQDNVKQTLLQAFQEDRLAQSYLFCGPKGTGKTSTARILAKMVNCEKGLGRGAQGKETIPCNECESCKSITDGSNLDFVEIDAASNRGIDDIRALRENIKLAPSCAQKKVYIIDEVHMLTTEAFNALLKTLEEPPPHVLFILATTEVHKIPATILSRVQKLDFQLANSVDLAKALQIIVDQEKLSIEPEVLNLIARRAEGSYRDGQKLLDQLSSRGQKLTLEDVEEFLQSGSQEDVRAIILAIAGNDSQKSLEIVHQQAEKGINLKEFIHEMLSLLQEVLLAHYNSSSSKEVQALASKLSLPETINLINHLHKSIETMRTASIPALPLEVAVVESCQTFVIPEVARIKQIDPLVVDSLVVDPFVELKEDRVELSQETIKKLEETRAENSPELGEISAIKVEDLDQMTKLLDKWNYILETVKPYNYSLEALLRQVKVKSCDDHLVLLEVPYTFHQRILEAPKSRDLLESVIADVLGGPVKVGCILGARPVRVEEIANVELAADDEIIRVAAEIFNSEPIS